MSAQHTPGPWESRVDRTIAANGTPIARIYANKFKMGTERANAHLIAAAPDGLASNIECAKLLDNLLAEDWLPDSWRVELAAALTRTQAALSRALGEGERS